MNDMLRDQRCSCGKLLFRAASLRGKLEIKCRYCALITMLDRADMGRYNWIAKIDDRGVYIYVGDNIKEILGYSPEELLGRSMFDFYTKEVARAKKREFKEMASTDRGFRIVKNSIRCRNNRYVTAEACFVPYRGDKNNFIVGYNLLTAVL